jgi:H/ACA ribonucleoprotein complex subunit 3
MKSAIKICRKCTQYTMKGQCPNCGEPTELAMPPRFGPEDRWGKYRRRLKYEKGEL